MKVARLLSQGEALPQAAMGWNAVALNVLPVFNPTMGYVNYVVPAVFVLILHQVLLMGTGILGATQNQRSRRGESGYWQHAPVPALLLARTLVVGALFVLPVAYFFGFCFDHYGIARTAVPGELWLFTLPFLLATTWLGIVLGALFTRRDLPTQVVLVSSLPLVFLAGFIWPIELIPAPSTGWPSGRRARRPSRDSCASIRWGPTFPRSPATGGSCGGLHCCMALWRAGCSAGVNRALQRGRMMGRLRLPPTRRLATTRSATGLTVLPFTGIMADSDPDRR